MRSAALEAQAGVVRIRVRAGQSDKALAEVKGIVAQSKSEGIQALLLAADLYLEQGAAKLAEDTLARAASEARSPEDRRRVALARERPARLSPEAGRLQALYAEWERSQDHCLRLAAVQRRRSAAAMPVGMPGPPPAIQP